MNINDIIANSRPLVSEVKMYKGRPTIHINGNPTPPMIYTLTDVPGGRWSWEEIPQLNIRQFSKIGIKLFEMDILLEHLWKEDGTFDLEIAKKQIRGVLEVCPDAGIIFRFHVNTPIWWIKKHPQECVIYDQIEPNIEHSFNPNRIMEPDARNCIRFSLASKKWREESTEKFKLFLEEFQKTVESNALIGIQPACGIYGEWHQWGFLKWETDLNEPMRLHFKEWLMNKYSNENNLQKAWNDKEIIFEKVTVPDTSERDKTSAGIFRNPAIDQKVIDYYNCQHELIADNIIHFCKTVKESWSRPIITGTFYGYFFSVFHRQAAGGHLELQKILESQYIDYISGPQVYYPEVLELGEPYRSRSLIHSVLLHEKLWLDEMDQEPKRTLQYVDAVKDNSENYFKTIENNISLIKRNIMFTHSKGMGLWFYDFGVAGVHLNPDNEFNNQFGSGGYWDNPEYLKNIEKIKKLTDKTIHEEYRSEADVLLVYDTKIFYHLKSTDKGDPVTHQLIDWTSLNTFYSGVVFDPVHIDDLEKVNISNYKVVVFANTFLLSENIKITIKQKIAKDNRHLLWIYAPGFSNGETINAEFVNDITEINLELDGYSDIPKIEISKSIGDIQEQSAEGVCEPLFSVNDISAETFGYYQHDKKPAFVKKQLENYTSWFIGVPPTNADLLRFIFKSSGAHIYNDQRDIIYEGSGVITFHTKDGGKKKLNLKNGKVLELDLPVGPVTILIDNETGEII